MIKKLYYYTSFKTFKLILENGTLRFKESTSSNDLRDTKLLYESFISYAAEIIKNSDKENVQLRFAKSIFEKQKELNRISLVACFTEKKDSRLLWDAYTMNRTDQGAGKYNGVCLEINPNVLSGLMNVKNDIFDWISIEPIKYKKSERDSLFKKSTDLFNKMYLDLKDDPDQSQSIVKPTIIRIGKQIQELSFKKCVVIPMMNMMDIFGKYSPFYKHEFWEEEKETRALLSIPKQSPNVKKIEYDDSYYYDLPISKELISRVILGPEFNKKDMDILKEIDGKIRIDDLKTTKSLGTGIIVNR